jgi:hypothetical protein
VELRGYSESEIKLWGRKEVELQEYVLIILSQDPVAPLSAQLRLAPVL